PRPPMVVQGPPPQPLVYVQPVAPYRYRHRTGIGLIVGGGIVFGLFWAGTAMAGSIVAAFGDPRANLGYIPIAGPVVWAAPYNTSPEGTAAFILAILDTVMQGIGATLLLIGIL